MIGRVFAMLTVLSLMACARPNYVSLGDGGGGPGQEKAQGECTARFKSGDSCVGLKWEKWPTDADFGSLVFKVSRPNLADGSPVLLDLDPTPFVLLWMPSMGHGSAPVKVERLDVGTYRASNVFFPMKGEWEIHWQLKDGNAVKDEAILTLTF